MGVQPRVRYEASFGRSSCPILIPPLPASSMAIIRASCPLIEEPSFARTPAGIPRSRAIAYTRARAAASPCGNDDLLVFPILDNLIQDRKQGHAPPIGDALPAYFHHVNVGHDTKRLVRNGRSHQRLVHERLAHQIGLQVQPSVPFLLYQRHIASVFRYTWHYAALYHRSR